jgi:RNA polymerase sigma-54 factor
MPTEFNQQKFDFGVCEIGAGEQIHAIFLRAVAATVAYPRLSGSRGRDRVPQPRIENMPLPGMVLMMMGEHAEVRQACEEIKEAVQLITRLNPKPGGVADGLVLTQYVIPDFILVTNGGKFEILLNSKNAPELRISRSYSELFDTYDKSDKKDKKLKETVSFVKQKLDSAKWFIDAIKQRQNTLLRTMEAILQYQYPFFVDGDEAALRPMILKDIAEKIDMDISTVSRVANSKSIQTEFGVFPLKYFFSEGIATDSGEDVSNREVKSVLQGMVDGEDKKKPLSDDKLVKMLNKKGYNIARRTVAKYREQLQIPVARLRKEL